MPFPPCFPVGPWLLFALLASTAFAGCTGDSPRSVTLDVFPQNHSGVDYKFRVQILEGTARKFDHNFTLSSETHAGKVEKATLLSGAYVVKVDSQSTSGTQRTDSHSASHTFPGNMKMLVVAVGSDHKIDVEVET